MNRRTQKAILAVWEHRCVYRRARWKRAKPGSPAAKRRHVRYVEAVDKIREIHHWLEAHPARPALRVLALAEARRCVGIMEHGGNNQGEAVTRIIRENGGTGPEPWCGDEMAHCYRVAGSKAVSRAWAAVRSFLGNLPGIRRIPLARALPGDLVIFTFDHVGMFVRRIDANTIETIEGNTGASGAVSDSSTGGDGVYIKHRPVSLVRTAVRVTR